MGNASLAAALESYAAAESRYVAALEEKGLAFAEPGTGARRRAELRAGLAERGVVFRNAGASLSTGFLSPACVACTGSAGSETFSTTFACHRDCYFCFNRNQPDYERFFAEGCPWEEGLERARQENASLACIGLTGGEPLLDLEGSLLFLERAGQAFPEAHLRMYTSGDLLTEDAAVRLRDAGLREIRFSVKNDDPDPLQDAVVAAMGVARRVLPTVMVEMPVVPGSLDYMKRLFRRFAEVGIDGINLLEFCFPFCNWDEFARRGFVLRNPPFDVLYDYGYSGGLAVAGSEEAALELMTWALDEDLSFGMHYCSLDNKHRSEIRQKNERAAHAHPCLMFDERDFFLKAGKVFGEDVAVARPLLEAAGCVDVLEDDEEGSIAFHPRYLPTLRGACRADGEPIDRATCLFVYETGEEGGYLVDVALRLEGEAASLA